MSYVQEFNKRIASNDFNDFLQLWEEYCAGDEVDTEELNEILNTIKHSHFKKKFGEYVETALPLWEKIEDKALGHETLCLIFDLQTSNSPELANLAYEQLHKAYSQQKYFNEKIRLIGLRNRENFQGALRNYDLLSHLDKGRHVFHHGGWGTGEIIDVSLIREELILEFENVLGRKDMSFANAFKNLVPLPEKHFLALRFGNPDALEEQAKKDPIAVIHLLLKDLGPKTASEIKDALYELVIPANDWTKWWQSTRSKIKKDTMIASPKSVKEPFALRSSELSHDHRFEEALKQNLSPQNLIATVYQFTRDFPEILKNPSLKKPIVEKLGALLQDPSTSQAEKLQTLLFFDMHLDQALLHELEGAQYTSTKNFICSLEQVQAVLEEIEIIALKKRALLAISKYREDSIELFLKLLLSVPQSLLKDYLLKELMQDAHVDLLEETLKNLVESPTLHPETFIWYFQKVLGKAKADLPHKEGRALCRLFEAFLILYHYLETAPEYKELCKKMFSLFSTKRYENVRTILKESTIEEAREILLLVSKCQSLSRHDVKIVQSCAEVVHPNLAKVQESQKEKAQNQHVIWTTELGYAKVQERIHEIGTVETVENAKEIEAARALGDLRENSEYKFALEKRSRLQAELKMLSDQVNKARILTKNDIDLDEVGVGTVVKLKNENGKELSYTILGPWEADPDEKILSFRSKFAQVMQGHRIGEQFSFQDEEYTVLELQSYL